MLLAGVMTGTASVAQAANYTWDASGTTPSAPTDGGGTWDTTAANWVTGVAPSSDVPWVNGSNVAILGKNNGAAGTVTLGGAITTSGITFNAPGSGSYTVTGGSLAAPAGTSMTITANVNATIASPFAPGAASWNSIEVNGPGVLTLTGASNYVNPIMNINAGATVSVPVINNNNVAGPLGQSSGGTRIVGGTLVFTGSTTNVSNHTTRFSTVGGTLDMEGTGVMNLSGLGNVGSSLSANRTITLTGNTTAADNKSGYGLLQNALTEYATLTNGAKTSLLKTGSGAWYSSAANTYSGATRIEQGRLGVMNNSALPATTTVTLGKAGTTNAAMLDLGPVINVGGAAGVTSYNVTVAGIAAVGNDLTKTIITNNDTSAAATNHVATLTVNPNGAGAAAADSTFGGLIVDGATSKVALVKAGGRTLTLSGNNTYGGGTTVSGGTLGTASTGGALGTGNVSVLNAGTVLELGNNSSIADTSTLSLAEGSVLNMQFTSTSDPSTFETVDTLVLGGTVFDTPITFSAGNYHGFDAYFTGSLASATLQVGQVAVPEPTGVGLIVLSTTAALMSRRNRRSIV